MHFDRIEPLAELKGFIECYWIIRNDDPTPIIQKIIPDGYPEIIFHFGDAYEIKLEDSWVIQSSSLVAGQISHHFHLRNRGISHVLGIKLQPTALTHLYKQDMELLSDKVLNLAPFTFPRMSELEINLRRTENQDDQIKIINAFFLDLARNCISENEMPEKAIGLLRSQNGMISMAELLTGIFLSERQFGRVFKKYVGLSPKLYARIIRFNYIFHLREEKPDSWKNLALEAAYYDQSHFIREFKAFTGENPGEYLFDEKDMANFFLKMKRPAVK